MQDRRLANFQIAWCAHGFLRELVLIYPVYAIMMGENDVSPTELALLFAAWSLSVIVLEVPSGALADRLSRKHLIAAGGLIKGVCFLVWLAMPTFWGYLIGFLVWGLGSSLASGTREALVHDTLKDWGAERLFVKVHGRGTAAQDLGVVAHIRHPFLDDRDQLVLVRASIGLLRKARVLGPAYLQGGA